MTKFYIPRRKTELIRMLLPTWKGTGSALKSMDTKQLRGIFYSMRERQFMGLMGRCGGE